MDDFVTVFEIAGGNTAVPWLSRPGKNGRMGSEECNSLVPILPAGHRAISLNCYTAQLERLPYLQ